MGPDEVDITLPLVIDVDVALLVQQALGNSTVGDENATIFEICAAINATGLDTADVLDILNDKLGPIVEQQIAQLVLTIVQAINDLIGINPPIIDWTAEEVIEAVDIQAIVDEILADVEVSLGILEECLDLPPTPPPTTETLTVIKNVDCLANSIVCSQNPISPSDFTITIQGNNPSQTSFLGSSTGTDVE